MLRACGHAAARQGIEDKRTRSTFPLLALVFTSTLALMTVYEVAKSAMFPANTLWQSHLITIVASSIVATLAVFYVLRKLQHTDNSYRQLVEMSPDAVWVHREGKIVIANNACAKLFGVPSPESLLGKHILDLAHPRDHDAGRLRAQNQLDESTPARHSQASSIRRDRSRSYRAEARGNEAGSIGAHCRVVRRFHHQRGPGWNHS